MTDGLVDWHGLRFGVVASTYGIEDPSDEQARRLVACYEHYRTHLPPDMKVELYGNRVRIEPAAFGLRGAVIDGLADRMTADLPDGVSVSTAPHARGIDHAREQLRRAKTVAVPDGFIRIVEELTGFEDDGAIGVIYLVLKERWALDRPF